MPAGLFSLPLFLDIPSTGLKFSVKYQYLLLYHKQSPFGKGFLNGFFYFADFIFGDPVCAGFEVCAICGRHNFLYIVNALMLKDRKKPLINPPLYCKDKFAGFYSSYRGLLPSIYE